VTGSSRESLIAELDRLQAPRRVPADDYWNFTDLGLALAKTVDEMNRPGANNLQFVFVLTDFVHEPHGSSPYVQGPDASAWQALAKRGEAIRAGKALQVFGLVLPVDGRAGRDIDLVKAVLGELNVIRADAGTLSAWFERQATEIHRTKLALLARADLAKGWSWTVSPEGRHTVLSLRSNLERLTVASTWSPS